MDYVPALARWLHFMAGVMWIGLLYYFNFVQVAALKAATADQRKNKSARGATCLAMPAWVPSAVAAFIAATCTKLK